MSDLASKDRCSGTYPAVWRFNYTHEVPRRDSDDNFTHMETVHGQFDVVAPNQGFAIETFKLERPASVYALVNGPTFVCYVDAAVGVSKNYGGHFS